MSSQPFYAGSTITAAKLNSLAVLSAYTTTTDTVSSTSPAAVPGLACAVASGLTYRFRAVIPFVCDSTHSAYLFMAGPATSFFSATIEYTGGSAAAAGESQVAVQTAIGTNTGCGSTTLTAGQTYKAQIDGIATFTATGTLVVNAAASANVDTFTTQPGGVLDAWQVLS